MGSFRSHVNGRERLFLNKAPPKVKLF